jgi:HD-like signal output (HDOD) protein/ActR/RegA family two-component response regulator
MKRILFVDDDVNVLNGLRRGLHSMKDQWRMDFVESGVDALAKLNAAKVDAIVTDVRMPGLDGLELLQKTRKTWPQVVRIVLSGQADETSLMHLLSSTHAVLTKPCDLDELKSRITCALANGNRLGGAELRNLISEVGIVPSLSFLLAEVTKEFKKDQPSIESIAQIISMDLGMSSAVLHFVNSGYFGTSRATLNPERAVHWLGLDAVRELILSNNKGFAFDWREFDYFDPLTVASDAIATGAAARALALARSSDAATVEDAYAAGLFHDIGQIVLARVLGTFYDSVVETSIVLGCPLWETERQMIGATHAQVGAYLLGLWGFPESVLNAVSMHHSTRIDGRGLEELLVDRVSNRRNN